MSEDLGTEEVASGVDNITSEYPHQRRDPSDNLGLQDHKVDQPPKQGDASFGAGRSTVENIFDGSHNCKTPRAPAQPLPQLH